MWRGLLLASLQLLQSYSIPGSFHKGGKRVGRGGVGWTVVPQALAKVLEVVHCLWLAEESFLLVNGGLREKTVDGVRAVGGLIVLCRCEV